MVMWVVEINFEGLLSGGIRSTHGEFSGYGVKADVNGVFKVWRQGYFWTFLLLLLICWRTPKKDQITTLPCRRKVTSEWGRDTQRYSLLSPPGKMERRRTFLFFSSGAIGSGLEAWFSDEESRELLFILKGGAGGFSSISTLSDIFSSTQKFLRDRYRGRKSFKSQVSACDTITDGYFS